MTPSALAQLSYDDAVRSLDLQERAVEQLRARTATLLAASSLTASFFGAQTIQRAGGLGLQGALALASLVGSIGICVYILLPKSTYVFGVSGREMYEDLNELSDDDEVRRRLIYWLALFWTRNQTEIETLDRWYVAAAIALMLQLMLWSLALTTTIT